MFMARRTKQRTREHIIDAEAQNLFRQALPRTWVIREYRPDYGIDYDVEIFGPLVRDDRAVHEKTVETLGAHVFIQLKACHKSVRRRMKVYARDNVEKASLTEDKGDLVGDIEVISLPIEVPELLTVQAMGAALPVLLVIATLDTNELFFVCLNDYIDKILAARENDYASATKRTIHVPTTNRLQGTGGGPVAFRWYGMRAKLYAGFQKFVYQRAELAYAYRTPDFLPYARHFAKLLLRYDFWANTPFWSIIPIYGAAVDRFSRTGDPGLMRYNTAALEETERGLDATPGSLMKDLKLNEVMTLWQQLTVLPRNYEDVCREWMLPTSLGLLTR
jgi:hypothetical protein